MILVTGITGKSGSWFLRKLIAEQHQLNGLKFRAVIRSWYGCELLDTSGLSLEYVYGDLNDPEFANHAMKGVKTVLHIAGIHTSLNVVQAAVKNNVQRIILVHTTGIFSRYKSASSDYITIEKNIEKMVSGKSISMTILRPTMIYGNLRDGNVIVFIKMVAKLKLFPVVNQAKYPLQPVYYKDLGEAYYRVLMNEEVTKNKSYILSGKEPILLRDMFKVIGKHLGTSNFFISVPFPVAYMGAWLTFLVSFGKIDYREKVQRLIEPHNFPHDDAARDFGYSPVSFEEGVKNEIMEFKKNMKIAS